MGKQTSSEKYLTQLVCRQPGPAMPRNPGPSPPCQPKEKAGPNHPQPEEIQTLTMQLRHIGDSVNHRMIQEHFPQEVGDALVPFVVLMFMRGQMLLRFFWNNHLL